MSDKWNNERGIEWPPPGEQPGLKTTFKCMATSGLIWDDVSRDSRETIETEWGHIPEFSDPKVCYCGLPTWMCGYPKCVEG